jgi:glucose/arabinose dehydrogenase
MRKLGGVLGVVVLAALVLVPAGANAAAKPAAAPINLAAANVALKPVATGLTSPVAIAFRGKDTTRMYVAQQTGSIVSVTNGHASAPLVRFNVSSGGEEGLLGIAFSNNGKKLYADITDPKGDIRIIEFTMSGAKPLNGSRRQLLTIPHHTFPNHNGGDLQIGADNMLYISVGDGGGGGDTLHNGQNTNSLLGKILRINPNRNGSAQYSIPPGNPFAGQAGKRGAIWMYGLRNPWRFSFDRANHDLWIGDVGQNLYEEIDYAKAGEKGINYGWNAREGFHPYNGGAMPAGARDPLLERSHDDGDCAITGGYVYRSKTIANFYGAYVFGDTCTGELRAVTQANGAVTQSRDLNLNIASVSTFGEGPYGGLYAASLDGTIYSLVQG